MEMRRSWFALGLAVLAVTLRSPSADAAPYTWVSGTGVDTGACPETAPCRSFQYALTQTRDGGTIAVRSPGIFAGVRINKSVTLMAEGVVAILRTAAANCGAVVCVDANQGVVTLRGLTIDAMHSGADGIRVRNVGLFFLQQSTIRQSRIGLLVTCAADIYDGKSDVVDSTFTENDQGLKIVANRASTIALHRVRVQGNAEGVLLESTGSSDTINASIADSVIAGQTGSGIRAVSRLQSQTLIVRVTTDRTAILYNRQGIVADGSSASVGIADSTITGNSVALRALRGGAIPTYGTNKLDGNGSGETPTGSLANQ